MSTSDVVEIDELKLAWQALERRIERVHAVELASYRRARLLDVRRALRPLVGAQLAQAALGALMVVWFALFWVEHRASLGLLALGAIGQAWAALITALAVRELVDVSRIDHAAPVLALQRQLAQLRERRLRAAPFLIVSGCAMWLPVTLVVFAQLDGAARWGEELPRMVGWFEWAQQPQALVWLLANVVLVPVLAWLGLRWLRSVRRPALAKRVDDELAGRSVVRAESMLAEIAEFERD
ncbi:MAG: hypothetical protein FJ091_08935 [Deltaproteobacteria bacterium]|nr:hypothetical protein [Deltaproteobacteria bacterium]